VFRTTTNTTIEGRTGAEIMAKWPNIKRVGTMSPDYAFGQDVTRAFVTHLKKIRPDIEIVDQQWPKLGETDYTPFINAQMSKKPDAVFSSLWGGHFVTFAKQAKPLRYFDSFGKQFPRRRRGGRDRDREGGGRGLLRSASGPIPYDASTGTEGPQAATRTTSRGGAPIPRRRQPSGPGRSPATIWMQILDRRDCASRLDRQRQGPAAMKGITVDYPDRFADYPAPRTIRPTGRSSGG
jgi:hypothetical protein